MVQALLTSIKNMVGSQAATNREFKTEAARNNRNVSAALKDIYKMFSASRETDSSNSISLGNIEKNTTSTTDKIDRSNALLQESISIQTQMISELRSIARSITLLSPANNSNILNNNQNQTDAGGMGLGTKIALGALGVGAIGAAGFAGAGLNEYFMGSQPAGSFSGVGSSENAQKALEFFKQKGWTPEQAAGIVGNLQAESSKDLNPSSVGDGGKAYGIAQWHPDRQANFERQFRKSIRQANFEEQLAFIQWELENTERKAGQVLKGAKTAAEAAALVDQYYERSSGEHRGRRIANANRLIEGDDAGTYQTASLQPQDSPTGSSGGKVNEMQRELAGVRKLPLNSRLRSVLQQAAAAAGVDVTVYSGGQARAGEGGPRTGSTRHDHGNAADLYLTRGGKKLSDTNPEDRAIMAKFVSAAVSAGATGVGAGHDYMGPSNIHVGFGKSATWGGAPWIKSAASGVYSNKDLQAENTDTTGGYMSNAMMETNNLFGSATGMMGSMGQMDNAVASLIAGYFGLPSLAGMSAGGTTMGESGQQVSSIFDESTESEPQENMGRSAGPGGVMVNSPEFANYQKQVEKTKPKEGDFFNYEYENLTSKIQEAAVEEKTNKVPVNSTKPYSQQPMGETRTDFGAVSGSSSGGSSYETRASWAPRIAVLRPDDDVTKPLTWAARIRA